MILKRFFSIALLACAATLFAGCGGSGPERSAQSPSSTTGSTAAEPRVFPGSRTRYLIAKEADSVLVTDQASGTTYWVAPGRTLVFDDASVNTRIGDLAASIPAADLRYLILLSTAYFNRIPDADSLAYWIERFKGGMTLGAIGDTFDSGAIPNGFPSVTGAMTHAEFVAHVSRNVLGDAVDPQLQSNWISGLDTGTMTRGGIARIALNIGQSYKGDPVNGHVAALLDRKFDAGFHLAVQQGLNFRPVAASTAKAAQIAAAVTPSDTAAAIALAGVTQAGFSLYSPSARRASDPITLDSMRACPASMHYTAPDFHQCLVGVATGTVESGSAPCKLTVHEDGRFAVTTGAGTRTVSPPYGRIAYSKLDHSQEGYFSLNASMTENASDDLVFSMAFVSPPLAALVGGTPGIWLRSGPVTCTFML